MFTFHPRSTHNDGQLPLVTFPAQHERLRGGHSVSGNDCLWFHGQHPSCEGVVIYGWQLRWKLGCGETLVGGNKRLRAYCDKKRVVTRTDGEHRMAFYDSPKLWEYRRRLSELSGRPSELTRASQQSAPSSSTTYTHNAYQDDDDDDSVNDDSDDAAGVSNGASGGGYAGAGADGGDRPTPGPLPWGGVLRDVQEAWSSGVKDTMGTIGGIGTSVGGLLDAANRGRLFDSRQGRQHQQQQEEEEEQQPARSSDGGEEGLTLRGERLEWNGSGGGGGGWGVGGGGGGGGKFSRRVPSLRELPDDDAHYTAVYEDVDTLASQSRGGAGVGGTRPESGATAAGASGGRAAVAAAAASAGAGGVCHMLPAMSSDTSS